MYFSSDSPCDKQLAKTVVTLFLHHFWWFCWVFIGNIRASFGSNRQRYRNLRCNSGRIPWFIKRNRDFSDLCFPRYNSSKDSCNDLR